MPFEFRLSFSTQYIEYDRFVGELQRELRRLMREAGAVYYNNLILQMPVDTGFLAGSFEAMRRATNASGSPSSPTNKNRRNAFYTHFGDRRVLKNPTNGQQFATKPEDVLSEITDGKFKYKLMFYFKNEIRYYPIMDLYGIPFNPPWRLTARAARAALAYLGANLPKILPSATSRSIKQQLISYRPGSVPQRIKV